VLEVYTRPYDPKRPQVCLAERPVQLLADCRPPLPPRPGTPTRQDSEYERRGTANLFLWYEPLAGVRPVVPTQRRTMVDWARCIRDLVDVHYPEAERLVLVLDNRNTHSPASLYQAFPPAEAQRLATKLEIHHTRLVLSSEWPSHHLYQPGAGRAGRVRLRRHRGNVGQAAGTVTNTATVATAGDTNVINNQAIDQVTVSPSFTLTVNMAGTGSGLVDTTGISCGTDCTEHYEPGTSVSLITAASDGSIFAGWGGACTGTGACNITMDADKVVTATFTLSQSSSFSLTVTMTGGGSGTVTSSPAGITCANSCTVPYPAGIVLTLAAAPTTGSTFAGWSGVCAGTGSCQVTMDAAKTVTATFQRPNVGVIVGPGPVGPGPKTLVATLTARAGCGSIDRIRLVRPASPSTTRESG
jgi:hypothetical protein